MTEHSPEIERRPTPNLPCQGPGSESAAVSLAPHHFPCLSLPGARPVSLPRLSAGDSAGLLWQEGLRQVAQRSLVCALGLAITRQPGENTSQECPCRRGCGSSPKAPWQSCHPQRGLEVPGQYSKVANMHTILSPATVAGEACQAS